MKKLIAATLGLTVLLTGCYKVDYTTGSSAKGEATEAIWRHRVVFGYVELDGALDLKEVCPSGVAKIHTEKDIITGVVGVLTSNIYTPSMISVWCKDGTSYRATVDGDTVVSLQAPVDQDIPAEIGLMSETCVD